MSQHPPVVPQVHFPLAAQTNRSHTENSSLSGWNKQKSELWASKAAGIVGRVLERKEPLTKNIQKSGSVSLWVLVLIWSCASAGWDPRRPGREQLLREWMWGRDLRNATMLENYGCSSSARVETPWSKRWAFSGDSRMGLLRSKDCPGMRATLQD